MRLEYDMAEAFENQRFGSNCRSGWGVADRPNGSFLCRRSL